ncbi:MAG TPA: flavodoxin [Candidatus Blautia gallistercoris]|uniref:Flavodoxin n=1 Tax=Candidatus Blautia gallistercoris TaxID=2838490 RepID=A0A9D1WFC3_9FIRM|nr:flavodoxin [Candidatus Blautia gallistercoris]
MKKITAILLSVLMTVSLAACGQGASGEDTGSGAAASDSAEAGGGTGAGSSAEAADNSTGTDGSTGTADSSTEADSNTDAAQGAGINGNVLIAYFSVPETDGVDTVAGASRVANGDEVLGNTQYIAQLIQQQAGGDLFRIETVQEYPGTHDALLEFAYNELSDNARPELATQIENPDSYDVIFLGYPNWNAELPMPLYTFLESYDFSGKTIVPFVTHGGSSFSGTIQTIQELQPDATVIEDGLSISRNDVPDAQADVADWVAGLNV